MAKKTEIDYLELSKSRGFSWIDKKIPQHIGIHTIWECGVSQCPHGHSFFLTTLSARAHTWAETNLEESIPILRKILYETYGYDFSDMQDYDIARLDSFRHLFR